MLRPIQDPNEMDLTLAEASARVRLSPDEISRALGYCVLPTVVGSGFSRTSESLVGVEWKASVPRRLSFRPRLARGTRL